MGVWMTLGKRDYLDRQGQAGAGGTGRHPPGTSGVPSATAGLRIAP